jgi:hypothetical protein
MAKTATKSPGKKPASGINLQPVEDKIRQRAYQLYLERGATDGGDVDDWLRAEQEVSRPAPRHSRSRS